MDSTEKLQLADDYDASALAYEEHWGLALAVLAEDFVESVPLSDAERILDVGAGTGRMLQFLSQRTSGTVFGIDRSLGMLRRAP